MRTDKEAISEACILKLVGLFNMNLLRLPYCRSEIFVYLFRIRNYNNDIKACMGNQKTIFSIMKSVLNKKLDNRSLKHRCSTLLRKHLLSENIIYW